MDAEISVGGARSRWGSLSGQDGRIRIDARLLLDAGRELTVHAAGTIVPAFGEFVVNTAMAGYPARLDIERPASPRPSP